MHTLQQWRLDWEGRPVVLVHGLFPNARLQPIEDSSYTLVPEDQPAQLVRLLVM